MDYSRTLLSMKMLHVTVIHILYEEYYLLGYNAV
jgi:hypothetical protein